jgi:hypothetical protein
MQVTPPITKIISEIALHMILQWDAIRIYITAKFPPSHHVLSKGRVIKRKMINKKENKFHLETQVQESD